MTELKSCPFCGRDNVMTWHIGHRDLPWMVECMGCMAEGPWAKTEEEAMELWNRRYNNGMVFALSNMYPEAKE